MLARIAVAASGRSVVRGSDLAKRAGVVGQAIAELGCNLITGGGSGAMEIVAKSFYQTRYRAGRSIGVIPGDATGFQDSELGTITPYTLSTKPGYPNRWIEIPLFTHLGGADPKGENSRNFLNAASADILVCLHGGSGTQAELEIALGIGRPVVAFVREDDQIGSYTTASLPKDVLIAPSKSDFMAILREWLAPFALTRPTFDAISAVYKTDPTQIHTCSMHFPNTCAIRMSEALDKSVSGIKQKFIDGGVNLCPHKFVRGAEDLAGILKKSDVFGMYDAGFKAPGSAPSSIQGKKGLVAYINIPDFSGQGHIDLWNGAAPVGNAYWNADPIWFWKLNT